MLIVGIRLSALVTVNVISFPRANGLQLKAALFATAEEVIE